MIRSIWTAPAAAVAGVVLAVASVIAVILLVDLSPKVEGDFFFAEDDPQMRATRRVAQEFPSGDQLILRVADLSGDPAGYREAIRTLTEALLTVPGVEDGYSISRNDPSRSPLYRRILLTPDSSATNIVLVVNGADPEVLLPAVEAVVARYDTGELDIVISGVPAIVEMIRRSLYRDLVVFSVAAVLVFAFVLALVWMDPAVVAGTIATCLVAVGLTLLLVQSMNVGIGLLTANLVTIVFVLTLSHTVFLSSNWRRAWADNESDAPDRAATLEAAVRLTWEGSLWSMITTLLGFASLLVATARPLRELGVAGVVGSLTALVVAYTVYPPFLGAWAKGGTRLTPEPRTEPITFRRGPLLVAGVVVLLLGSGLRTLDTDPGLLSYFSEDSELYEGLARIDADGGSSTLDIVVEDPGGEAISAPPVFPRLQALQSALEADSAVGVVLSPTVLIEHARTIPLAGLLPPGLLLDIASSDALNGVGRGFVSPDRRQARFSLRMRETMDQPREQVMNRLQGTVEAEGLRPVVMAGLYDLQAQLGRLIAGSLRIGIGGLLLLFFVVALVVARSLRVAASMWVCLAAIPVVILGTFGLTGTAVDIITSPAANIALAIGADAAIHLVVRVRRLRQVGFFAPWAGALAQIGPAVLRATAVVSTGFGIFVLSSFPPTRRFGVAVIVGTFTAAAMTLVVLPRLACLGVDDSDSLSRPPQPPPVAV